MRPMVVEYDKAGNAIGGIRPKCDYGICSRCGAGGYTTYVEEHNTFDRIMHTCKTCGAHTPAAFRHVPDRDLKFTMRRVTF